MIEPENGFDPKERLRRLWGGLLGVFFAACIVKFGNPAILDDPAVPIRGLTGAIDQEPATNLRYYGLAAISFLGFALMRRPKSVPAWILFLPLAWLGWQFIASIHTVDRNLTLATLKHFTGCVACFYLGLTVLAVIPKPQLFWAGLLVGFLYTLYVGWDQHWRGLEAMRQYFMVYTLPKIPNPPPELLKRINSRRIFGTFVYANALAGAILLLLPALIGALWHQVGSSRRWSRPASMLLVAASLPCLYWTGSKAGWLIALVMVAVMVLLSSRVQAWMRWALVLLILCGGVAGFFLRFAGYFERGATSVSARFQYWEAAKTAFVSTPWVGTGPGTFGAVFRRIKPPEAEMAQLTHNDYLEQASDSGLPGCLSYTLLWLGSLAILFRGSLKSGERSLVWLGLGGWALHGFVEFALYIPGSAWPAFTLLGWLWGTHRNAVDNHSDTSYGRA